MYQLKQIFCQLYNSTFCFNNKTQFAMFFLFLEYSIAVYTC